ncbi:hypothetical protein V6N11_048511 [Hibiscus sabdariffa]|uniref:Uncharacterized protein n=1 Tax=Hibiscus sabdariffa TaxID=183260 RepID=A0ABR2PW51_9ROSI
MGGIYVGKLRKESDAVTIPLVTAQPQSEASRRRHRRFQCECASRRRVNVRSLVTPNFHKTYQPTEQELKTLVDPTLLVGRHVAVLKWCLRGYMHVGLNFHYASISYLKRREKKRKK